MNPSNEFMSSVCRLFSQEQEVLRLLEQSYQFLREVGASVDVQGSGDQEDSPWQVTRTRLNIMNLEQTLAHIRHCQTELYEHFRDESGSIGLNLTGGNEQHDRRSTACFVGGDHAHIGEPCNESIGESEGCVNQLGRIGTQHNEQQCGDHVGCGSQWWSEPSTSYNQTEKVLSTQSTEQNNVHAIGQYVLPWKVQSKVLNLEQSHLEGSGSSNEQNHHQHSDQHQDIINEQDDDVSSETSDSQSRRSG